MKFIFNSIYEKILKNEFYAIFIIVIISILYRTITATYISSGGDAFYKWFQVKRLLYGFSFDGWPPLYGTWNHHTARWAIIFPTLVFQYIFGTHPVVYYLIVVSIITSATVFLYKIALNIYGVYFAFSTSLLFIFFPVITTIGSQFLPAIFSCFYMLASFYFIILFLDKKYSKYVLFSAVMLFFAYASKITNLFFVPGYIYILYKTKHYSKIKLFLGTLILFFVIENILFYIFSDGNIFFGKIQCIFTGHVRIDNSSVINNKLSILYFISRWFHLPISWLFLFIISIPVSIYLVFNKLTNQKIKYIVFLYFCFILFETFAIKSIHPLRIAEPFRARYLAISIPFMLLIINYFILSYTKINRKTFFIYYIILIFMVPFVFKKYVFVYDNNIVNSYVDYKKTNHYFHEGYTILFKSEKELYRFVYVFLDDKYIFQNNYIKNYIPIFTNYNNKEFYSISKNNSKTNGLVIVSPNYGIK